MEREQLAFHQKPAFAFPERLKKPATIADVLAEFLSLAKGQCMIQLTRLNNARLAVNCDLIKYVEEAPDTVLTLVSGEKLVVRETTEQVIERVRQFRRSILANPEMLSLPSPSNRDAASNRPTDQVRTQEFHRG